VSVLDEILAHKRSEVAAAKARLAPEALAEHARTLREPTRGFRRALLAAGPRPRVIADFDPVALARAFEAGGAAALSVLTDERFFGGSLAVLERVRQVTPLPLLRKDFVIDAYQIDEARVAGADAILLIAAALPAAQVGRLREHALALGLDALVEVHDEAELDVAKGAGADLIGINNRDLKTFHTDLAVTERLAKQVPEGTLVVAESGIFSHEDVARLLRAGAAAFLVGESLMREPDPGRALWRLLGTP
jgi:indole-3-glycerol phosphate synthase